MIIISVRRSLLALILISSFITIFSLEVISGSDELRLLLKYGGQTLLIVFSLLFVVNSLQKKIEKNIRMKFFTAFLICSPFFGFFVGEFLNSPDQAIVPFFRYITALLITYISLTLRLNEIKAAIKWFSFICLILVIIGVIFFAFQLDNAEKFPLIDMKSSRSIIFEQNIFGIICFFAFILALTNKDLSLSRRLLLSLVFFIGMVLSYYKTVIIISLLYVIFRLQRLYALFMVIPVIIYFVTLSLDNLLLITQIDQNGLTSGRTELWQIAVNTWINNPLFGVGESNIASSIYSVIPRSPPFTTFHNLFFDMLVAGGLFGIICLICQALIVMWRIQWSIMPFSIYLLPAFFNTYYLAAPNAIGFLLLITMQYYRLNINRRRKIFKTSFPVNHLDSKSIAPQS